MPARYVGADMALVQLPGEGTATRVIELCMFHRFGLIFEEIVLTLNLKEN